MKSKMTSKQFRTLRLALGFSKRKHVAAFIGASVSGVRKWEDGSRSVPEYAAKKLREAWNGVRS